MVNDVSLGDSVSILIKKVGEPDSSKFQMNEFSNNPFKVLFYDNAKFYAENNIFTGFDIKNPTYKISSLNISVGDNVSKLENIFPDSYKKYKTNNDNFVRVRINQTDSYLLFEILNDKIIRYHIWTDW